MAPKTRQATKKANSSEQNAESPPPSSSSATEAPVMAPPTQKKMTKNEKQEALARARRWADKRHGTDAPAGSLAENEEVTKNEEAAGNEEVAENEERVVDTSSPSSESHSSPVIVIANQETSRPTNDTAVRWRYYFSAIVPLAFLIIASQFLRATISPPPSDYGSGSMFDSIAPRYDFINRALALNLDTSWRERLVKEVVGAEGEIFSATYDNDGGAVKILDLATGTADVAILLGKAAARYNKIHPPPKTSSTSTDSTIVLGLDPSQNMLDVGVTKVQSADLTNIVRLQLGDARKLDSLEDETFNAVTMSFGIRNVPEKEMALCEIHRVLKKGAHFPNPRTRSNTIESKLAIMEFSEPTGTGIMATLARLFIRHCVPAIGAILSGRPKEYMHLQKSIADFPSPTEFVKLMESLKCPFKKGGGDGEFEIVTFGSFRVKEVVNLNFGSVQIYVATPILKRYATE
jgi:demethylmenaquinone methyltransferase/2-methoxy-6-polyprenyl-1,4-benzoquinol methylase